MKKINEFNPPLIEGELVKSSNGKIYQYYRSEGSLREGIFTPENHQFFTTDGKRAHVQSYYLEGTYERISLKDAQVDPYDLVLEIPELFDAFNELYDKIHGFVLDSHCFSSELSNGRTVSLKRPELLGRVKKATENILKLINEKNKR